MCDWVELVGVVGFMNVIDFDVLNMVFECEFLYGVKKCYCCG